MSTETTGFPSGTTAPVTREAVQARLAEIAPTADEHTPDPALALAKSHAVSAQMHWHSLMEQPDPWGRETSGDDAAKEAWGKSAGLLVTTFGIAHLLKSLHGTEPELADRLARELVGHWDDGESIGELLWSSGRTCGG